MAVRRQVPDKKPGPALVSEVMSDGLVKFTQHTLKPETATSPAEAAVLRKALNQNLPGARMAAMERTLAALPADASAAIALRVAKIREIYADIRRDSAGRVLSLNELDRLDLADKEWREIMVLRDVMLLAAKGVKFNPGRDRGAFGPVRAEVRRTLKRKGMATATAAQVWKAIAAKPPKGMHLCDNNLGQYIETAGHPDTSYARFANIVSLEKKAMRGRA